MEVTNPKFFPFDEHKTLAVAQNILSRLGDKEINYMYLLKLVFFADRYHLRKYLRPVTSDRYFAMKNGAVASHIYDICKGKVKDKNIVPIGEYTVKLEGEPQYQDELSKSDLEAIDFSLNNFAQFSEWALSEITHAYPEWKKFEAALKENNSGSYAMDITDFLSNADRDDYFFRKYHFNDPFAPIPDDEKEILKAQLSEVHSQIA